MTTSKKRVVLGNTALGAAGTAAGTLVVWGLNAVGAGLESGGAAAVAGAVAGITIFVLRHGVLGLMQVVWKGSEENGQPPPPRTPAKR